MVWGGGRAAARTSKETQDKLEGPALRPGQTREVFTIENNIIKNDSND